MTFISSANSLTEIKEEVPGVTRDPFKPKVHNPGPTHYFSKKETQNDLLNKIVKDKG